MAQLVIPKQLNPLDDVAQMLGIKSASQGLQLQKQQIAQNQQQAQLSAINTQQQAQLQALFKDPASWGPDGKPTKDALMKVGMIHPATQAELLTAYQMDPKSLSTIANQKNEIDNRNADNTRADIAASDVQYRNNEEMKRKAAEEAAGITIPGTEFDIKDASGKTQRAARYKVRQPDGSYKEETRMFGEVVAPPKAPDAQDELLTAFNADPKLTAKYGTGLIGLGKYQQDQKVATAIAGRAQPAAQGDFAKTGDEFLSSIPQQWRQTVQKIANYDEDPTKVASMRGGMREQLMQWVNQVNPEYDSTLFGNRAPTRKAFTVGTQGQQINAMNTVLGHLDQMNGAIDALNHGKFVPGNEAYDYLKKTFGDASVTNFENVKGAVAGELGKVLKGVVTDGEIARTESNIRTAGSPEQLRGAIKTNIPILGSKLAALNYQYHQAMGENDPFQALSPASKKVLEKYGFDSEHPEIGGGKQPVPARAGYTVMNDPKGVPHYVKNEEVQNAPPNWSKVQ